MKNSRFSFLKGVGGLELMAVLFPIIAGYGSWGMIWSIAMIVIAFFKSGGKGLQDKILLLCFAWVFLHTVFVWIVNGFSSTVLNHLFAMSLYLLTIIVVPRAIDYNKFVPSLYWVAIIAAIGLVAQFMTILAGGTVSPIAIPFLPKPDMDSRLWAVVSRPTSFFWEPSSYTIFTMFPLFISLINKQTLLSVFFFFSILLSTSSNGIFMAPVLIVTYVLFSKTKRSNKIFITIALALMIVFFLRSSIFDIGKNKIENTEFAENARIANGPALVKQMPAGDLFFGIQETTVMDYLTGSDLGSDLDYLSGYFVSDFWYVWVMYGIIGLVFYLLVYFHIFKIEKSLLPYIIVLLIAQFTQSVSFRSMYVYQMICIWTFVIYNKKQLNNAYV